MSHISFAYPWVLLLLLCIPGLIFFLFFKKANARRVFFSVPANYADFPKSLKYKTRFLPDLFYLLSLSALILVLARPQGGFLKDPQSGEGIDIVLALDVSSSMLSRDLLPDRLSAAKEIAANFIKGRPSDRIGLVIFSGESYTLCPLTLDHNMLVQQLKMAEPGFLQDGTAIGDGLGLAVARLIDSPLQGKVIIQLTDGVSTRNTISPEAAADEAAKNRITVYTIGVGTMGSAMTPVNKYAHNMYEYARLEVNIDEDVLKMIANKTKGKYFRATDNESLEEIFKDIDKIEKSKMEDVKIVAKPDIYQPFLIFSFLSFFISFILNFTLYRKGE